MVTLVSWAAWLYYRRRDVFATLCLLPAICLKFYPVLLLVFLLRRRKMGLAILCVASVAILIAISFFLFKEPAGVVWSSYRANFNFFRDFTLLTTASLEGASSPWNAYKITLITLQKADILPVINFDFDGEFIRTSYLIYSVLFSLFTLSCLGYVWLCESRLMRGIIMLFLLISMSVPTGPDYRLMYASLSLVFLIALPERRRGDWIALTLIALVVIPKKEILLTYIGPTETGYADVPIQSFLNPILILAAMAVLFYGARPFLDRDRAIQRLRDVMPSRWRWI